MNNLHSADLSITLPDGRRLSYAELGDAAGTPLLYCHGFPGSRMEALLMHETATRLGIRVIAPDRPGFGGSDHLPGRNLSDWSADIKVLADLLKIDEIRIIGLSGGGPYALSCASGLNGRVSTVSLVCSLASLAQPDNMNALSWPLQLGFSTARTIPWMSQIMLSGLTLPFTRHNPEGLFMMLLASCPSIDQKALSQPHVRHAVISSMRESLRGGTSGASRDLELFTIEWQFDLADIRQPVQLWHGSNDQVVPIDHGRWLAAALPQCDTHYIEDEGHYSLPVNFMEDILSAAVTDTGETPIRSEAL